MRNPPPKPKWPKKKFRIAQDWKLFWFYFLMLMAIGVLILLVESLILVEDVMCRGKDPQRIEYENY